MMHTHENADELRTKIENYRISRRTAVGAMQRWLDALIEDAEEKLQLFVDGGSDESAAPPSPSPRMAGVETLRSTYPFDENAPRQRSV